MSGPGTSVTALAPRAPAYPIERLRRDFPILQRQVHGRPLVYLDNAASSQKPAAVIEALDRYYRQQHANVHRGIHTLSEEATGAYEEAREKLRRFIGAGHIQEIIFTRGTTEAINLVAQSWARTNLKAGDEILISHLEHHSNIVPWQLVREQTGAVLKVCPIDDRGDIDLAAFDRLLSERTRLVAVAHVSNALGTINPVAEIARRAHAVGALVLVDGAQAVPHERVDVQALGCDFYAFSSHKMYGPTGVGVLYGRSAVLDAMPPWQGGGDMILHVEFDRTVYNHLPHKFEAGTPAIADAIGLGAAVDYLESVGLEAIAAHEAELLAYGTEALAAVPGLRLIGTARRKAGVLSFVIDGAHPHDIGTILDREGVAVRSGHHCAQPVMKRFGVNATTRASLALYNGQGDLDRLVAGLGRVLDFLRG